jgi:hypothetical protein
MINKFLKLLFSFLIVVIVCGCGKKSVERKYSKELFFGNWQGKAIIIVSTGKDSLSTTPLQSQVKNYGSVQCLINPDDTYKFDLVITNDIYGRDIQSKIDYGHLLISAGYRWFTKGHFSYNDSTVEFYNYQNNKVLQGILYSYDDDLYLRYIDKYHNEWNIQFVKTN